MANSDFNKITLMLPAGCGLNEAAETINGAWQKELSLFFSIEEVDEETFRKRLAEGDYTIALAPVSAESGSVYNTLAQFTPTGGGLTGYSNALYATQLEASTHANGSTRCRLLGECERQLLSDCVVVPLFSQQKRLLIASGVKTSSLTPSAGARSDVCHKGMKTQGPCANGTEVLLFLQVLMPNNRRRIPRRHFGLLMTTTCIQLPPFVV